MTEHATQGLQIELRQAGPIALDLTLDCAPGEIVALVGPSGAGKTTVLRAIAGLVQVSHGHIRSDSEVWLDTATGLHLAPHLRSIGMVFQAYALHSHLSGRGNVELALSALPRAKRHQQANEWLQRLGVAELGDRHLSQLSGGQQQRIAIARALAREPRLLLDEPLSAVDGPLRQAFARELTEICRRQRLAVLWVTHDLDEAARVADRIGLMDQGRMLQFAKPDEVLHRPSSLAAARAVGIDNLLPAKVVGRAQGGVVLAVGTLHTTVPLLAELEHDQVVTLCVPSHGWLLRPDSADLEPNWVHATLTERWTTRSQDRGRLQLGDGTTVVVQLDGASGQRPLGTQLQVQLAPGEWHAVVETN